MFIGFLEKSGTDSLREAIASRVRFVCPSKKYFDDLTLNAPIASNVVCFSRLLKCLRSLYGKQCGPRSDFRIGTVCSGSTLFASILDSSVMLDKYLQQATSADNIFRCIFFLPL